VSLPHAKHTSTTQNTQTQTPQSALTVEVGVLDGDDARLGEDLLGEVVDQLAVDEARDACGRV